jgi:hypothetical protein
MMTAAVRIIVKNYLLEQANKYWDEAVQKAESTDVTRQLHSGLAPTAMKFWSLASSQSFFTRTGAWWEHIAALIGSSYHADAQAQFPINGPLSPSAEAHISQVIEDMNRGGSRRVPDRAKDISEVLTVQGNQGPDRAEISDLYLLKHDGSEVFFEIKTPGPNKGQCMEMKQRILTMSALKKGERTEVYAACAYNPYNPTGDAKPYNWNMPAQFLEIGADWLIGKEFWSIVGEDSTYDEVSEICAEVGAATDSKVVAVLGLLS